MKVMYNNSKDFSVCSANEIYYVLGICVNFSKDHQEYKMWLESKDDHYPFAMDLANFEVVDHSMTSNFGIYLDQEKQTLTLEPRSWHEYKSTREEWSDFWNDFYEGERAAIELYRKEVAFIKGEPYTPLPKQKPDAKELLEIYRRREREGLIPDQGFNEAFEPIALTSTENWKPHQGGSTTP
jgi:hypothetical protein